MTRREEIIQKAIELLEKKTQGMRYSEIHREILAALPNFPANTIHGTIWNLDAKLPDQFYKPAKGVFRLVRFKDTEAAQTEKEQQPKPTSSRIKEEDFYEAFADYLVNDLEECSKAIAVGGNRFRDKWGTPDVIGVLSPKPSDVFKFSTEIVSAEIKLDNAGLITAFGQACAYKLFSHKTYIVVPKSSPQADIDRLDSLSMIFGIGLIIFDSASPTDPDFQIKTRAARHEPDMFYVNRHIAEIADDLLS